MMPAFALVLLCGNYLFADCVHIGTIPISSSEYPPIADVYPEHYTTSYLSRYVMDRHGNGKINGLFLDASARNIDLKELWTLKWHKQWDTKGQWTLAGGVTKAGWEEKALWMVRFKDY